MRGNKFFSFLFFVILIFSVGCVSYAPVPVRITGTSVLSVPPPPSEKKLVAIAGFENKSTYSADKLWDTCAQMLMTELLRLSYFRVVEWAQMKRLFDWETLSTCSLVSGPNEMNKAQEILNSQGIQKCEYFLAGTLTQFDVTQSSKVSALSKKKTYITTIRVDLSLQYPLTGEYISYGIGEATATQIRKGGLGGGQTGTWDPASANDALERSIRSALTQLIYNFSRK